MRRTTTNSRLWFLIIPGLVVLAVFSYRVEVDLRSLWWAYTIVWILHVGYLLSLAVRQNSLRQEISTLKALVEQKGQATGGQ